MDFFSILSLTFARWWSQFIYPPQAISNDPLLRVFLLKFMNCSFFKSTVKPKPSSKALPHGCHDNRRRQEDGQEQGGLHGDVTLWIQSLLPAEVEFLNREQVLSSMWFMGAGGSEGSRMTDGVVWVYKIGLKWPVIAMAIIRKPQSVSVSERDRELELEL